MGSSVERFLNQTGGTQPPATARTSVERFLDETGGTDPKRLSLATKHAVPGERAARILELQKATSLTPDFIDRNFDEVDKRARAVDHDPERFQRQAPALFAQLAENHYYASLLGDDIGPMSQMESLLGRIKSGFRAGRAEGQVGRIGSERRDVNYARPTSGIDEATRQEIDRLEGIISATPEGRTFLERSVTGAAKIIGQMTESIAYAGAVGLGGAATGAAVGAFGGPITAAAGATAGFSVGFVSGLAYDAWRVEGGHTYVTLSDDPTIDEGTRQSVSYGVGLVNAGLETGGAAAIGWAYKPLARRFLRQSMSDALARPTMRAAVNDFGKAYTLALAGETSTEVAQEITSMVGEEIARMGEGGELDDLITDPEKREEAFRRLADIAQQTAEGMALLALPGASVRFSSSAYEARKATQRERYFTALGETIADSKAFKRLPAGVQTLVERQTKDGPLENVYAPVEETITYFQSKKLDAAAVFDEIGLRPQFDEAVRTGSDIVIPTPVYATRIAPTEHNAFFAKELRGRPNEMNGREAAEMLDKLKTEVETAQDATVTEGDPFGDVGVQRIEDEVATQLSAAGYEESVARSNAQQLAAFFRTQGQRARIDPYALFKRYGLSITAPERGVAPGAGPAINLADVANRALIFRELRAEREGQVADEAGEPITPYDVKRDAREGALRNEQKEFVYARTDKGALRGNLTTVSTDGLFDELGFLYEARQADQDLEERYNLWVQSGIATDIAALPDAERTGRSRRTTDQFGNRVKRQAEDLSDADGMMDPDQLAEMRQLEADYRKAARSIEARKKAIARVEAEIARRGVENADARLSREILGEDTSFDPNTFEQSARRLGLVASDGVATDDIRTNDEKLEDALADGDITKLEYDRAVEWKAYQKFLRDNPTKPGDDNTPTFDEYLWDEHVGEPGMMTDEARQRGIVYVERILGRAPQGRFPGGQSVATFQQSSLPVGFEDLEQEVAEAVRRRKQREALASRSALTRYMTLLDIADDARETPERREQAARQAADIEQAARTEYDKRFRDANAKMADDPNAILYHQTAFHGSPHIFDRFSLHKIGTGEGAQAYGWGLYFAGKKEIAEYYREKLTLQSSNARGYSVDGKAVVGFDEHMAANVAHFLDYLVANDMLEGETPEEWTARELAALRPIDQDKAERLVREFRGRVREHKGAVYEVDIPADDTYLDWDGRASEQSPLVQNALDSVDVPMIAKWKESGAWAHVTGQTIYAEIARHLGRNPNAPGMARGNTSGQESASRYLATLGINGIRYRDAASRQAQHLNEFGVAEVRGFESAAPIRFWRSKFAPVIELMRQNRSLESALAEARAAETTQEGAALVDELEAYLRSQLVEKVSYNYVVFDDQLIEIRNFEQALPGGDAPRGQIRFKVGEQAEVSIELLADADLSTFLHETGHFYLEVLKDLATGADAPAEIARDFAAVKQWLGWTDDQTAFTREQHEQWARGFEAYLMEGKAPSTELRGAFARFRAWLVSLYRSLDALNVFLTDEVRGVMDRMLATDDEITAAEREQEMDPLFADPAAAGMSEQQAARYRTVLEAHRETAVQEVQGKLIAQFQREQDAIYKAERARVRTEVAEEVNQERDSAVFAFLSRGTLPDGSALPPELEAVKLSKANLVEYEGRYPNLLARLRSRFLYAKEGGVHPDQVAEWFGYASGDELLQALLAYEGTPKQRIERVTDERMRAEDPNLVTPSELAEEAMKATHNEKRAQVLHLELEHLISQDFATFKGLLRRLARRLPPLEEVRAQAERIIKGKKVRELTPLLYQRAEVKAARAAVEAGLKGDWETAFDEKLKELLNHELYRATQIARETVDKAKEEARALFASDEKIAERRDMDLVNAARAIAASYGFAGAQMESPDEFLQQMRDYDPDTYEALKVQVDQARNPGGAFNDQTYETVLAMRTAIDSLWTLARRSRQIEIDGKRMDAEQVRGELEARVRMIGQPFKQLGYHEAVTEKEERKLNFLGLRAALRRVEHWVDAMDGGDPNGVFRRYIWNPISEGAAQYRLAKRDVIGKYLEIVKLVEPRLTTAKIAAREINYVFNGKAELLGAMLHTGNHSNMDKLLRGRGWSPEQWFRFVRRMQSEGVLAKEDYDYLQATWDLFEALKPDAQKAHRAMYGRYFDEITADPIATPWGEYKGGYAPARVDPNIVTDSQQRAEKEALEQGGNSFMFPSTGRGFTKSRVDQYARPLWLDLRMVPTHIDAVLRFVHIQPHVKDVGRLVMHREFRATLDAFDPGVGTDLLVPWLQRSATQRVEKPMEGRAGRATAKFFRELRRRTGLNIMAANVVNMLQQATGFSMAGVKVRPRYLRNALWSYIRAPKVTAEIVASKSDFMKTRVTTQVMEQIQHVDDLLLNPSKYDEARSFMQRHGYFLQAGAQNVVDLITWTGAYEQAVEGGADEMGAVRQADAAVRLTQGSFATEDVSRFETGTAFTRAFSMFYSYFNMQANLLGTEYIIVAQEMGLKKGAGRLFYVYMLGFLIPAIVGEAIVQMADGDLDDDDDGYLNDVLGILFFGQFRNASAMVPIVGPTAAAGVNAFNDRWYDDRISTSPIVTALESAARAPYSVWKTITDDGSRRRAIKDVLTLIGLLTGLPTASLARPAGYLADEDRDGGVIETTRGLLTGRSSP